MKKTVLSRVEVWRRDSHNYIYYLWTLCHNSYRRVREKVKAAVQKSHGWRGWERLIRTGIWKGGERSWSCSTSRGKKLSMLEAPSINSQMVQTAPTALWRGSFKLFVALLQSCFLEAFYFRDRSSSALINSSSSFTISKYRNTDKWQTIA